MICTDCDYAGRPSYKSPCSECNMIKGSPLCCYKHKEKLTNVDRIMVMSADPVLCNAGSGAIHHHYFGCPICGNEVGGFLCTGNGDNDWSTHKDKFCKECGQKIDWSNTDWVTIYHF